MPLDPLGYIQLTIQLTLTDTFLVLLYIEYGYIFGFIVYQAWIHFWFYCISNMDTFLVLLNQARRPARAWFLRIASVRESMRVCVFACVCVCVCPPPRLLITSGVMWCDIDPI